MVTLAPKRSSVLTAVAFALSCIGLIVFVWIQFGGAIPFAPQGYQVRALFPETGLLVPHADVRISGVDVGKVQSLQARGVDSLVTMQIDSAFAPIPRDTRAILRQKTLLGEAYVELSSGDGAGAKIPDGGTIPAAQVEHTQQLDQVLNSFTPRTQHDLESVLTGTGAALADRGQALNDAIGNLDPMLTELSAIVGVLNDQQDSLRSVIANGGSVLTTLGEHSADLQTLIRAGDSVLSATARRNSALTATVDSLPPFLAQLRITLRSLNATLGIARPSLAALRPVAPLLAPALRELSSVLGPARRIIAAAPALLRDSRLALPAIARFMTAFRPAVDVLLPAAQQIVPIIDYVYVDHQNVVAAMANLAAVMQASAPADTPSGRAHYLRALVSLGNDSAFGAATRDPTERNNTYYAPGELNDLAHGLKSATCQGAGSGPGRLGLRNVDCRVQGGFPWGHGVLSAYYPRLRAAPR
jgi:phospholipid/cholesterol/gamma-HCH transport system substrate-binding protein